MEQRRLVEPARLPVIDGRVGLQQFHLTYRLFEGTQTKQCQMLTHLLRDVFEEGFDKLGFAAEAGPQLGVLSCDADRAGV
ncbi:hypothetical protein GALL_437520 [mine drainage metagenome]|uniref:Uncharacterized protein n=1 Tax=mine drainage metagenome TaxID=410659 RepID=A0A1J5PSX2_9ZZZZ